MPSQKVFIPRSLYIAEDLGLRHFSNSQRANPINLSLPPSIPPSLALFFFLTLSLSLSLPLSLSLSLSLSRSLSLYHLLTSPDFLSSCLPDSELEPAPPSTPIPSALDALVRPYVRGWGWGLGLRVRV